MNTINKASLAQVLELARWLLIAAFVVLGYMVVAWTASIVAPILAALGIAYVLAPLCARLQRWGLSPALSAGLMLLLFVAGSVGLLLVVVPMLASDAALLIGRLPAALETVSKWLHVRFGVALPADWQAYVESEEFRSHFSNVAGTMSELAKDVLGGAVHVLAAMAESLLIPVFAFYFLADWHELVHRLQRLVPPRKRATVISIGRDINGVIAGWVRGQGIVITLLSILYAVGFSIIGIPGAVPLGLIVGGLTIIPFLGTAVGAGLTFLLLAVGGEPTSTWVATGIIFVVLHLLEAAILTPKIVGHRVGLSESAALFAVVAGGKVLGFVGVFLAVPGAAACGVLLRRLVAYYERSEFFGNEQDAKVEVTAAMHAVLPQGAPEPKESNPL